MKPTEISGLDVQRGLEELLRPVGEREHDSRGRGRQHHDHFAHRRERFSEESRVQTLEIGLNLAIHAARSDFFHVAEVEADGHPRVLAGPLQSVPANVDLALARDLDSLQQLAAALALLALAAPIALKKVRARRVLHAMNALRAQHAMNALHALHAVITRQSHTAVAPMTALTALTAVTASTVSTVSTVSTTPTAMAPLAPLAGSSNAAGSSSVGTLRGDLEGLEGQVVRRGEPNVSAAITEKARRELESEESIGLYFKLGEAVVERITERRAAVPKPAGQCF